MKNHMLTRAWQAGEFAEGGRFEDSPRPLSGLDALSGSRRTAAIKERNALDSGKGVTFGAVELAEQTVVDPYVLRIASAVQTAVQGLGCTEKLSDEARQMLSLPETAVALPVNQLASYLESWSRHELQRLFNDTKVLRELLRDC